MLPRLLSHFYCYAESRFSNPMVSGLAAYAMKRCSMKRKSITSGIIVYVATSAGIRSSEFLGEVPPCNACYMTSLYVLDFKCVLAFGEAHCYRTGS